MTKILVNFPGMQALKQQMQNLTEQLQALEDDISHSSNRLDWEVSQKHDIDEQIHKARRKAAFLFNYTEQMAIFTERAINDFKHTDNIFANQLDEQTGQLESLWRGFLEFTGHTFNDLSCDGMQMLSALKLAGTLFVDKATEIYSDHPGLLSNILALPLVGVTPLANFALGGEILKRLGLIAGGFGESVISLVETVTTSGSLGHSYHFGPLTSASKEQLADQLNSANKFVSIGGGVIAVVGLGALAVATAPVSATVAAIAGTVGVISTVAGTMCSFTSIGLNEAEYKLRGKKKDSNYWFSLGLNVASIVPGLGSLRGVKLGRFVKATKTGKFLKATKTGKLVGPITDSFTDSVNSGLSVLSHGPSVFSGLQSALD